MDTSRRPQRPADEELFMGNGGASSNVPDTPTVAPLRVNKRDSLGGSPAVSPYSNTSASPPPVQSYTSPQTSPPNRPLPYPTDDDDPYNSVPARGASPATSTRSDSDRVSAGGASAGSAQAPRIELSSPPRPAQPSAYPYPSIVERRANASRPVALSSAAEARMPQQINTGPASLAPNGASTEPEPVSASTEYAHNYYPPPSTRASTAANLRLPGASGGVNRFASTASVSTTRASRGSPPPPETPVADYGSGGGIEARYAAAGIAGPSTLTSLQASNLVAQQGRAEYDPQQAQAQSSQQAPPRRPWTPTEDGGGPALTYHGNNEAQPGNGQAPVQVAQSTGGSGPRPPRESDLEADMQHMQISDEPPPAYSSLGQAAQAQRYPVEKRSAGAAATEPSQPPTGATGGPAGPSTAAVAADIAGAAAGATLGAEGHDSHPAFSNNTAGPDPRQGTPGATQAKPGATPSPGPTPVSPPPLPEGWIAHMDPNSGQYYYIHLPTQSTQWEFPKGPTPLNLNDTPASPTGTMVNPFASPTVSTFSGKPGLASSSFPPQQAQYMEGMGSMAAVSSPTAAGFAQPPPIAGVDQYRVAPTNGVYFGPYLRYTNMDVDNGIWYGSVMLVTDAMHPPTIHIHQSVDLSPNPRQLKAHHIHQHQRWMFYRYDIDLRMEEDHDAKWTYAITSHLGCTRYEFMVAGRYETSWRYIAHSGNDFAMNVNANERTRIGGVGFMWKDILQKHQEVGGFHAQLGMGNQIYADRLWKEAPLLRQWIGTSGKDNRKNAPWTPQHEEEIKHAYFHFYTSHLDQPLLREAFAQIPHVLALDDHEIFDGFGSYPEHMQSSNIVKNIGRIGIEMYLLFQHHTTLEILASVRDDLDMFTITGTGYHFVKYLGPAVVVVGPDCRSERTQTQVMAGRTYQGLFPKIAVLPPHVQHCIWMIPVPIVYPRLDAAEQFAKTMATGKKVTTGTFNALGKVTSSVAGIVGAKGVVGEGFNSVKKAVGKSGLMSNVLSPFGELDILDELRDQWTHESKDLERTYLIRTLQGIAQNKSIRMTFFSGATNCCGAGLVHDPSAPANHKTMYQIISSSVVNAPPSSYVLRMLHPSSANQAPIFVPQNGHKSQRHGQTPTDTKEDMLELFAQDVNGQPRELKRLMGRRNYAVIVSYDPETVQGAFGQGGVAGQHQKGPGTVSLAIDFMVQAETTGFSAASTVKYGPVVIPSLEYGR